MDYRLPDNMGTSYKLWGQIKCLEAKLTKVRQAMKVPESKKRSYDGTVNRSRAYTTTKGEGKKKRRKLNERKRKVHGICVGKPLGNLP